MIKGSSSYSWVFITVYQFILYSGTQNIIMKFNVCKTYIESLCCDLSFFFLCSERVKEELCMPSTVTLIALTAGAQRCDSCTLNETRSSSPQAQWTIQHHTRLLNGWRGVVVLKSSAYKNISARKSSHWFKKPVKGLSHKSYIAILNIRRSRKVRAIRYILS